MGPNPLTMSYNDRRRRGTLRNMLDSSQRGGKILNALNFPMPEQGLSSFSFSTDAVAWNGTKGTQQIVGMTRHCLWVTFDGVLLPPLVPYIGGT